LVLGPVSFDILGPVASPNHFSSQHYHPSAFNLRLKLNPSDELIHNSCLIWFKKIHCSGPLLGLAICFCSLVGLSGNKRSISCRSPLHSTHRRFFLLGPSCRPSIWMVMLDGLPCHPRSTTPYTRWVEMVKYSRRCRCHTLLRPTSWLPTRRMRTSLLSHTTTDLPLPPRVP
jgi:hypothetical protein